MARPPNTAPQRHGKKKMSPSQSSPKSSQVTLESVWVSPSRQCAVSARDRVTLAWKARCTAPSLLTPPAREVCQVVTPAASTRPTPDTPQGRNTSPRSAAEDPLHGSSTEAFSRAQPHTHTHRRTGMLGAAEATHRQGSNQDKRRHRRDQPRQRRQLGDQVRQPVHMGGSRPGPCSSQCKNTRHQQQGVPQCHQSHAQSPRPEPWPAAASGRSRTDPGCPRT